MAKGPLWFHATWKNIKTGKRTTKWIMAGSSEWKNLIDTSRRISGMNVQIMSRERRAPVGQGPAEGNNRNYRPVQTWVRQAKAGNTRAAKNLQRFLRHQGYGLKVDGKWGPSTRSAYRFFKSGNSAKKWQGPAKQKAGNPRNRFNKSGNANAPVQANFRPKGAGKGKGGKGKGGRGGGNFSTALGGIQTGLGGRGASQTGAKLNVPQYAETLAGMQFDPAIQDIKTLIARLGPANAQNIQNIEDWYGDAQQAGTQAGARTAAAYEGAADQQSGEIQEMMAALGGGANAANPLLAAAGLNNQGYLRALGAVEQQYRADMDPILEQAAATTKTNEQRRNVEGMQNYQLELAGLIGQRGQAKAAANFEGTKYNNELAQVWFQNKIAEMNAALGAQSAGIDMAGKREQIAASRQQRQSAGKASKGGFIPWKGLNPIERQQLLTTAVYLPNGQRRSFSSAQNYLVSMGYAAGNSPTRNRAIVQALRSHYQ